MRSAITSVVVTHDVYESLKIVDYLYFVSEGRIVASGTPAEVRAVDAAIRAPVRRRRNPTGRSRSTIRRALSRGAFRPCRLTLRDARLTGFAASAPQSREAWRDSVTRAAFSSPCSGIRRMRSGASISRLREIYFAGVLSLVIILMSGLFVGMVLSLQGYETLKRYGSDEQLGILVALALVRELAPVIAGLLFASRAGSAITAEIGLMKTTEQLAAMEMMAVDPLARVVAPRFWGGVISMPLLAALFSAFGIFGGYLVGVRLIGIDDGAFWGQMQAGVDFWPDVTNGIIKSFVFGTAVSLIAVFEGYDAKPTAEGVSSATTRTVVISSLAILALDFVMTAFMFRGSAHESFRDRPLGRHLRRPRLRGDPFPRAQGRQPGDARSYAGLPARGPLRQHRRIQAARAGEGGRRRGRASRGGAARSARPTRRW